VAGGARRAGGLVGDSRSRVYEIAARLLGPGVVGFWIYQVDDDKLNGAATPANFFGLGNSTGNRFEAFSIGPSVGDNFGPVSMNIRYTRDLYAKNGPQGNLFWFRFALPL